MPSQEKTVIFIQWDARCVIRLSTSCRETWWTNTEPSPITASTSLRHSITVDVYSHSFMNLRGTGTIHCHSTAKVCPGFFLSEYEIEIKHPLSLVLLCLQRCMENNLFSTRGLARCHCNLLGRLSNQGKQEINSDVFPWGYSGSCFPLLHPIIFFVIKRLFSGWDLVVWSQYKKMLKSSFVIEKKCC